MYSELLVCLEITEEWLMGRKKDWSQCVMVERFGQELVEMEPSCMEERWRTIGDGLMKCDIASVCRGSDHGEQWFLKSLVSSLVVFQLLSALPCGHPPCLLPLDIKISFSFLGKASCQTLHQTLDQNDVHRHSFRVGHMNLSSSSLIERPPAPLVSPYFLVCLLLTAPWYDPAWPSGLQTQLPCSSAVAPSKLPCRLMETYSDPSASGHPCTIPQGCSLKTENSVTAWNNSTSSNVLGFNYSYFQPNASQISG